MDPATMMILATILNGVAEYAKARNMTTEQALEHVKLSLAAFRALPDHATKIDPATGEPT